MFKLFKKKKAVDPICGMIDDGKFIDKYGHKFCSEGCASKFASKNNIKKFPGSCCH